MSRPTGPRSDVIASELGVIALKCRMAFLHEIPSGRKDGQTERQIERERSGLWLGLQSYWRIKVLEDLDTRVDV